MPPELIEDNGILISNRPTSFYRATDPQFDRMLEVAPEIGWLNAIRQYDCFVDYVTNTKRFAALLKALPLEPSFSLLEIGPGLGQMTIPLARRVRHVDAVETNIQQARFCAIRAAQEQCMNVTIIAAGEEGRLPLPSSSYDFVIMNLVFEWCAMRSQAPHEAVQRQYLSEISRVLVPGGSAFISTKNRYALRLLSGGRDEHIHSMPFGSCLPRGLTSLLSKRKRHGGFLHSRPALRRMLLETGFSRMDELIAIPEMRYAEAYLPEKEFLSSYEAKQLMRQGLSRRARMVANLLPLSVLKALSPGLSFIVRK